MTHLPFKKTLLLTLVLLTLALISCRQTIEIIEIREADPSIFDNLDADGNPVFDSLDLEGKPVFE